MHDRCHLSPHCRLHRHLGFVMLNSGRTPSGFPLSIGGTDSDCGWVRDKVMRCALRWRFTVALVKATEAMPLTKLSASASTAFPLRLSEAPVALSWLPNTSDFGFRTPPDLISTRAIGAGGNSIERQGGYAINAINVIAKRGTRIPTKIYHLCIVLILSSAFLFMICLSKSMATCRLVSRSMKYLLSRLLNGGCFFR